MPDTRSCLPKTVYSAALAAACLLLGPPIQWPQWLVWHAVTLVVPFFDVSVLSQQKDDIDWIPGPRLRVRRELPRTRTQLELKCQLSWVRLEPSQAALNVAHNHHQQTWTGCVCICMQKYAEFARRPAASAAAAAAGPAATGRPGLWSP